MIRINLLGSPKPKGKKGPAFTMPSFEVGNLGGPLVQVAAVLLIAGALNFIVGNEHIQVSARVEMLRFNF